MRRYNRLRLTSLVLIGTFCCFARCQAAELQGQQSEEKDYVLGRPITEAEIAEIEAAVAPFAGAGGYLEEDAGLIYVQGNVPMAINVDIPGHYDVRSEGIDIVIETQRYGDCWAFAALDLLQINGQKQGIIGSQDLSERHLVYYTYHSVWYSRSAARRKYSLYG